MSMWNILVQVFVEKLKASHFSHVCELPSSPPRTNNLLFRTAHVAPHLCSVISGRDDHLLVLKL